MAADALDILTITEAREAINVATGHASELERMITGVSRRIDDLCGPVVVRTVTDELHDANGPLLFPKLWPVFSVTTVTEYQSGTGTVITAEAIDTAGGYLLENGRLVRRSGWVTSTWRGRISVTYVAGRYATTAAVDPKFKLAAAAILRRLWVREAGAWARGTDPFLDAGAGPGFFKAVDPMVREFLGTELLPPTVA